MNKSAGGAPMGGGELVEGNILRSKMDVPVAQDQHQHSNQAHIGVTAVGHNGMGMFGENMQQAQAGKAHKGASTAGRTVMQMQQSVDQHKTYQEQMMMQGGGVPGAAKGLGMEGAKGGQMIILQRIPQGPMSAMPSQMGQQQPMYMQQQMFAQQQGYTQHQAGQATQAPVGRPSSQAPPMEQPANKRQRIETQPRSSTPSGRPPIIKQSSLSSMPTGPASAHPAHSKVQIAPAEEATNQLTPTPSAQSMSELMRACKDGLAQAVQHFTFLASQIRRLCPPEVAAQLAQLISCNDLENAQQILETLASRMAQSQVSHNQRLHKALSDGSEKGRGGMNGSNDVLGNAQGEGGLRGMSPSSMAVQQQHHTSSAPMQHQGGYLQRSACAGQQAVAARRQSQETFQQQNRASHSPGSLPVSGHTHQTGTPSPRIPTMTSPVNSLEMPTGVPPHPAAHQMIQHQLQHQGQHQGHHHRLIQGQYEGPHEGRPEGFSGHDNMQGPMYRGGGILRLVGPQAVGNYTSQDQPHLRLECLECPFVVSNDRLGVEGGTGNELFCPNCFCFVCDCPASECQGWLCVGHCHASDRDPYWSALRCFTRIDMLCDSPLLVALECDTSTCMEAHMWCLDGLIAFQKFRDGDKVKQTGEVHHSFQHVTDVSTKAIKAVVEHLSMRKSKHATLAVLDGITSSVVVNTWRPDPSGRDGKADASWGPNAYPAYRSILDHLEKLWVLAIAHTSTRCVPSQALDVMIERLRHLSKLAENEVKGCNPPMTHVPFTHAICACERGWTHPAVVSILKGQCKDRNQIEPHTLQRARLHVFERTKRWQEAYYYAAFHGHFSKSLSYLVRVGRSDDVIPKVHQQGARIGEQNFVPVCDELVVFQHRDMAMRLAMYCAFGEVRVSGVEARWQASHPYVEWLVNHVLAQVDPAESQSRNAYGPPSAAIESARRDAEDWARQMSKNLNEKLLQPSSDPPIGSMYSQATCAVERVSALCAVCAPALSAICAKVFADKGDACAALSIVLLSAPLSDSTFNTWAIQELIPKMGIHAVLPAIQLWRPDLVSPSTQMAVATALMRHGEQQEGMRWASSACQAKAGMPDMRPFMPMEHSGQTTEARLFVSEGGRYPVGGQFAADGAQYSGEGGQFAEEGRQ